MCVKASKGARSAKQAIAIGLSKARRAGIPLAPPAEGTTSEEIRTKAEHDIDPATGEEGSTKRGRAQLDALMKEPKSAASHTALSLQAKSSARKRGQKIHKAA